MRTHRGIDRLRPIVTAWAHIMRSPIPAPATWLISAVFLVGALTAPDADAVRPAAQAAAIERFQHLGAGDVAGIEALATELRSSSAAEPGDPVLRAYAGASTAKQATTTWLPWRKIAHVEDGLALIDKALAQLGPAHDAPAHRGVPASLETRFVAANTFLALPAMFNRHERGARLLADLAGSPLLDSAPLAFRAEVWLRAGIEAAKDKRSDEARKWLDKVAASGAPQASAAQLRLKEI